MIGHPWTNQSAIFSSLNPFWLWIWLLAILVDFFIIFINANRGPKDSLFFQRNLALVIHEGRVLWRGELNGRGKWRNQWSISTPRATTGFGYLRHKINSWWRQLRWDQLTSIIYCSAPSCTHPIPSILICKEQGSYISKITKVSLESISSRGVTFASPKTTPTVPIKTSNHQKNKCSGLSTDTPLQQNKPNNHKKLIFYQL